MLGICTKSTNVVASQNTYLRQRHARSFNQVVRTEERNATPKAVKLVF